MEGLKTKICNEGKMEERCIYCGKIKKIAFGEKTGQGSFGWVCVDCAEIPNRML